jgi:hypothetical protein
MARPDSALIDAARTTTSPKTSRSDKTLFMSETESPARVVEGFMAAMGSGDLVGVRARWADDAVWHLTGSHELAGDHSADGYFEMLGRWATKYPDYQPDFHGVQDYGTEAAVAYMESARGMAPGAASGLLVYRVVQGRIREGWAIPTFCGGAYAF